MRILEHFRTVTMHKIYVMRHCFKMGIYLQGFLHDMSKYSPTEFVVGCLYYQGDCSPNNAERLDKGFSSAWLHHKGRNKHHFEYWVDYSAKRRGQFEGIQMPRKYVAEMVADRVAACKVYAGSKYTDDMPFVYYMKGTENFKLIHPQTKADLKFLLKMISEKGEDRTFAYIKNVYLKKSHRCFVRHLKR